MDVVGIFRGFFHGDASGERVTFTPRTVQVLEVARQIAEAEGRAQANVDDVALALSQLRQGVVTNVLARLGVDLAAIQSAGTRAAARDAIESLLSHVEAERRQLRHTHIGTEHLFLALVRHEANLVGELLKDKSVSLKAARKEVVNELNPHFDAE